MAQKTITVSDLTGEEIRDEENTAHLLVQNYPGAEGMTILDVRPEEVEAILPQEPVVLVSYIPPGVDEEGQPREATHSFSMTVAEFNKLSDAFDMETVVTDAYRKQQEEARQEVAEMEEQERRAARRGRRARGERRERIDYSSPEYAGLPHRGRVTDKEKEYVRNNLDAVNEKRRAQGHDPIDPSDPKQAERYGLTASQSA